MTNIGSLSASRPTLKELLLELVSKIIQCLYFVFNGVLAQPFPIFFVLKIKQTIYQDIPNCI